MPLIIQAMPNRFLAGETRSSPWLFHELASLAGQEQDHKIAIMFFEYLLIFQGRRLFTFFLFVF